MSSNSPKPNSFKLSLIGVLLCGCVPHHSQVTCQELCAAPRPVECCYCAAPRPVEYCYDVPVGYVISQEKYDPHFVPCPPKKMKRVVAMGCSVGGDGDAGTDDGDGDDSQSSSTGGGNGAHAQQGNQSSVANAGQGAGAQQGSQLSRSGGGRGAWATEGGVGIGANAGDLL